MVLKYIRKKNVKPQIILPSYYNNQTRHKYRK